MDFYTIVEKSKKTGKLDKGTNEVTKAVERATAQLVVYAQDVEPKEIVAHLAALCKQKNIPCVAVDSKQKLGIAAGIKVSASAIAIIDAGDAKKDLASLKVQ